MRFFTIVTLYLAAVSCFINFVSSIGYDDGVKPSHISRRAIDGTRGRKYFNPQEDGFLDDYGFEKGQYHGNRDKFDFSDIRSNVPGEPGIDYPAYVKIPKTGFSCFNRDRGYYADEDAGCQVFHVCDDGLTSSFLCPVGSLFSQQLLTCDWWSRVSCSESHKFYNHQSHVAGLTLNASEMLRQVFSETVGYPRDQVVTNKSKKKIERLTSSVSTSNRRSENQFENDNEITHKGSRFQSNQDSRSQSTKSNHSTVKKVSKDPSLVRIKMLIDEKRRTKTRGHTRSTNNSRNQHNNFKSFSSTSPTLFITTTTIKNEPYLSQENNMNNETTMSSDIVTIKYTDSISTKVLNNYFKKRKLEEDMKNLSKHSDSAYQYDEMEGKETIGLITSHAERNLEDEEARITSESTGGVKKKEITSLVYPTSLTNPKIHRLKDNAQLKERINFLHSKIREKLEFFEQEKNKVITNPRQEIIKEIIDPIKGRNTDSKPYIKIEIPKEVNNYSSYDQNVDSSQIPRPTKVYKSFNLKTIVINDTDLGSLDLPLIVLSSSNYKKAVNSTNTPFPTAVLSSNLNRKTTTIPSYFKPITDPISESNSPFEAVFPLERNSSLMETGKSPIGVEIIGRLISHQESQPINFDDLEIVKSDQINEKISTNENQHLFFDSLSSLNTFPNLNLNQKHQDNQSNFKIYRPDSTTLHTFTDQLNYQSTDFTTHQTLPQSLRNQQFLSVTQRPQRNYENYLERVQNSENRFRQEGTKELNIQYENNFFAVDHNQTTNQNVPIYYQNPQEHTTPDINSNQSNDNQYFHNQHPSIRNYFTNYQTHNYPENTVDYIKDYDKKYDNTKNYNYRNTENIENLKIVQSTENYRNYKNRYTAMYAQNNQNERNKKYSDYRNNESSEDLEPNSHFKDFGARIITNNQNVLKVAEKGSQNSQRVNERIRNLSNLQGKGVSYQLTTHELAKTDRLPRPFHDKNNFNRNLDNKNNDDYIYNKDTNNFLSNYGIHLNTSNLINYNDNFNVGYQQNFTLDKEVLDHLTPPKLDISIVNKEPQDQKFILFLNPRGNNRQTIFGLENKQNESREENYVELRPFTETPYQMLHNVPFYPTLYTTQKSLESNTFPFNNIPQLVNNQKTNFKEFITENIRPAVENIQIPSTSVPQTIDINYYPNTEPSVDPIRVSDKNNPEDNFQQNVGNNQWVPRNPQILKDMQPPAPDYDFHPPFALEINNQNTNAQSGDQKLTIPELPNVRKPIVETEFIPSISFDFGSDEGTREYLDALRKGLVSDDSDPLKVNEDNSSVV